MSDEQNRIEGAQAAGVHFDTPAYIAPPEPVLHHDAQVVEPPVVMESNTEIAEQVVVDLKAPVQKKFGGIDLESPDDKSVLNVPSHLVPDDVHVIVHNRSVWIRGGDGKWTFFKSAFV